MQEEIKVTDIEALTPVTYDKDSGIYLKRDDLFEVYGSHGGKARSAYQLILQLIEQGYSTIVTAGSRQSPQCEIVSMICEGIGIDCKLFMPNGEDTSVIKNIKNNSYTEIIRVRPAYNNVLIARSREFADKYSCGYVPFGMECLENVEITSKQVQNIPKEVKRIVMPVGSGMSISSVATGMLEYGIDKPLLGIRVGKDPIKTIYNYCNGIDFLNWNLEVSKVDYHTNVEAYVGGYRLDPIYEAKCREYLQEGDLLWVVGRRKM